MDVTVARLAELAHGEGGNGVIEIDAELGGNAPDKLGAVEFLDQGTEARSVVQGFQVLVSRRADLGIIAIGRPASSAVRNPGDR
jgi:hypothetical protein